MSGTPDDQLVCTAEGVGTTWQIAMRYPVGSSTYRFEVYVSSGPKTQVRGVFDGDVAGWLKAMDFVAHEIAREVEAEGL